MLLISTSIDWRDDPTDPSLMISTRSSSQSLSHRRYGDIQKDITILRCKNTSFTLVSFIIGILPPPMVYETIRGKDTVNVHNIP